jgi:hypothetical protein
MPIADTDEVPDQLEDEKWALIITARSFRKNNLLYHTPGADICQAAENTFFVEIPKNLRIDHGRIHH